MGNTQTFRGKVQLELSGDPWRSEVQSTSVPGSTVNLLTYVVPSGKTIVLLQTFISCRYEGIFRVKIDGALVGSLRTGAGSENAQMSWAPYREALELETIVVEFEAMSGRPAITFEAYLQGRVI